MVDMVFSVTKRNFVALRLLVAIALSVVVLCAAAAPVVIPFSAIQQADPAVPIDPAAPVEQRLAQVLRRQLEDLGFDVQEGALIGSVDVPAYREQLATFCAVPLPKQIETDATVAHVTLDPTSQVELNLDNIQAMRIAFSLTGALHTQAPARVIWGQAVPFAGNCEKIGTDSGTLDVALPFKFAFALDASVTPQFDVTDVALVLDKRADIVGDVAFGAGSVTPKFGGVSLTDGVINAFQRYLLDSLRRSGAENIARRIQILNFRLDGLDAAGSRDESVTPFNGQTAYPLVSDPADAVLARALLEELGIPRRLVDLLYTKGGEMLLQLLASESAERKALVAALVVELGCDGVRGTFGRDLPRVPLYRASGTACIVADVETDLGGPYYSDALCSQEVAFRPTSDLEFCAARLGPDAESTLGNAAAWIPQLNQPNDPLSGVPSRPWTTQLSNRLDIGVVGISDAHQPYVKQVAFKTIDTPRPGVGSCQLEMRVFKKDIVARNLQPLLAIHGGTWRNRGFSFLGLEATIAHFTERGFVVFAPFYRLVGGGDGNAECNQATWAEVTEDVEDALQWVQTNGPAFGAALGPVALFGQSAGAHLATWLATHKPADVERALLFYPPLDVLEFLDGAIPVGGRYAAFQEFGIRALSSFFGAQLPGGDVRLDQVSIAAIDFNNPALDLAAAIPEAVFDLTAVDLARPPLYMTRCAATAGVDLATVDPAAAPPQLLACLRRDIGDFLRENAFLHQVRSIDVPINVVHGAADSLVPYGQSVALCNAIDGGARRSGVVGDRVSYRCGADSNVTIIAGAEHALDLGLCVGTLCPAGVPGTPQRAAAQSTVIEAYDWLAFAGDAAVRPPAPTLASDLAAASDDGKAKRGGGGVLWLEAVLIVLGFAVARKNGYPLRQAANLPVAGGARDRRASHDKPSRHRRHGYASAPYSRPF